MHAFLAAACALAALALGSALVCCLLLALAAVMAEHAVDSHLYARE